MRPAIEERILSEQPDDDTHPLELDYPDGETLAEERPLDADGDHEGDQPDDDDHPGSRVTIPDIGHCAGSGAPPVDDTIREGEPATGTCAACSGRFDLRDDGTLALHAAAPVENGRRRSSRRAPRRPRNAPAERLRYDLRPLSSVGRAPPW